MATTWSDFPPESVQTKQKNGGFIAVAKSLEDYHGGASASVPFTWESQPGTPKDKFSETTNSLLPLTPPPAAYYSGATKQPAVRKSSRPPLLHTIFAKRNAWKSRLEPSSPDSSSPSSSSSSSSSPSPSYSDVPSSPITALTSHHRRRLLSYDSMVDGEDEDYESPAVSGLLFSRGVNNRTRLRGGCCSSISKVLLRD